MKDRKRKIPVIKPDERIVSKKIPPDLDGFTAPIGWNFSMMDQSPDCPWRCTYKRLSKYRDRLLSFEGKSFQDIEKEAGSSHSWPDTSKLNKKFQEHLARKKIDSEALWQLELDGKARLFGVRVLNVFKVIWLDENHSVYPVKKKHT